jgi:hypothetical protein
MRYHELRQRRFRVARWNGLILVIASSLLLGAGLSGATKPVEYGLTILGAAMAVVAGVWMLRWGTRRQL